MYFESALGSARVEFGKFNNNANSGLSILTKGNIYLSSIQANNNGDDGAFLSNMWWDAGVGDYIGTGTITVTSPKSGSWLQGNAFNGNGIYGLEIFSKKSVNIYNTDASEKDRKSVV